PQAQDGERDRRGSSGRCDDALAGARGCRAGRGTHGRGARAARGARGCGPGSAHPSHPWDGTASGTDALRLVDPGPERRRRLRLRAAAAPPAGTAGMGYLIDTNVLSELRKGSRGHPQLVAWSTRVPQHDLYLSVMVLGEVRCGIERLRG